jgi:hypothetical protein
MTQSGVLLFVIANEVKQSQQAGVLEAKRAVKERFTAETQRPQREKGSQKRDCRGLRPRNDIALEYPKGTTPSDEKRLSLRTQ